MKRLSELLDDVRVLEIENPLDPEIVGLEYDSRRVETGTCFIAVVGVANDGHDYIDSAIERGAKAVICQKMPQKRFEGVSYVVVEDSNIAMAAMAAAIYDHPSEELRLVGVTGTACHRVHSNIHPALRQYHEPCVHPDRSSICGVYPSPYSDLPALYHLDTDLQY